jgi:hypothetical protein
MLRDLWVTEKDLQIKLTSEQCKLLSVNGGRIIFFILIITDTLNDEGGEVRKSWQWQ